MRVLVAEDERVMADTIVEGLRRRRALGLAPFTVMSCDNLPGNGHLAKEMFASYAELADPELADWVRSTVAFPNSMVDRITPVTTDDDKSLLAKEFALRDEWPVVCEDFTQWVLQDVFPPGRPPWERAGVHLVHDVVPYELMKLRLLNASHQAMAYAGYLAGYRYAHEVAADPVFIEFLRGYMQQEGRPTLPAVPGTDLDHYIHTLLQRFANPAIRDTLARLAAFSSDRIPKWLVPVIQQNLASGGEVTRSAAVVASWARYAEGVDENGERYEIDDILAPQLRAAAGRQRGHPAAFLEDNRAVFGDLADDTRFTRVYSSILTALLDGGVRKTFADLDHYAIGEGRPD